MITIDDKLFCVLASCENGIGITNLTCYMYTFQVAGFDFDFKFKLQSSGLKSRFLDNYIDSLVNDGYLWMSGSCITLTEYGRDTLEGFILSLDDLEKCAYILGLLNRLDRDDLYLMVVIDLVISEVREKEGVEGLAHNRDKIVNTIKSLTSNYTDEDFNAALKFLRIIKGE